MEDKKLQAEALKGEGNAFFAQGHYLEAIEKYSQAIELDPKNHILYANRAFAHLKMENYGNTISDATIAIETDPTFPKSYFHRANAHYALMKYENALLDFLAVVKMLPQSREARQKYDACNAAVRKARFEAAIASEETKPASEMDLSKYGSCEHFQRYLSFLQIDVAFAVV